MTTRYSESYYMTVKSKNDPALQELRDSAKVINAFNKKRGINQRYVVRVAGRLGENNPNADFYRNRKGAWSWSNKYQWILHEHATRFDVYVYVQEVYAK